MIFQPCSFRETPHAAARRSAECPIISPVENSAIAGGSGAKYLPGAEKTGFRNLAIPLGPLVRSFC